MARPLPKSGLVYFPFDIISGKGIQQIEADFGLKGFAVMMKLLQSVYSQGYYMPWNPNRAEFFQARSRFVAYGGARGGGKNWAVRQKAMLMVLRYYF